MSHSFLHFANDCNGNFEDAFKSLVVIAYDRWGVKEYQAFASIEKAMVFWDNLSILIPCVMMISNNNGTTWKLYKSYKPIGTDSEHLKMIIGEQFEKVEQELINMITKVYVAEVLPQQSLRSSSTTKSKQIMALQTHKRLIHSSLLLFILKCIMYCA